MKAILSILAIIMLATTTAQRSYGSGVLIQSSTQAPAVQKSAQKEVTKGVDEVTQTVIPGTNIDVTTITSHVNISTVETAAEPAADNTIIPKSSATSDELAVSNLGQIFNAGDEQEGEAATAAMTSHRVDRITDQKDYILSMPMPDGTVKRVDVVDSNVTDGNIDTKLIPTRELVDDVSATEALQDLTDELIADNSTKIADATVSIIADKDVLAAQADSKNSTRSSTVNLAGLSPGEIAAFAQIMQQADSAGIINPSDEVQKALNTTVAALSNCPGCAPGMAPSQTPTRSASNDTSPTGRASPTQAPRAPAKDVQANDNAPVSPDYLSNIGLLIPSLTIGPNAPGSPTTPATFTPDAASSEKATRLPTSTLPSQVSATSPNNLTPVSTAAPAVRSNAAGTIPGVHLDINIPEKSTGAGSDAGDAISQSVSGVSATPTGPSPSSGADNADDDADFWVPFLKSLWAPSSGSPSETPKTSVSMSNNSTKGPSMNPTNSTTGTFHNTTVNEGRNRSVSSPAPTLIVIPAPNVIHANGSSAVATLAPNSTSSASESSPLLSISQQRGMPADTSNAPSSTSPNSNVLTSAPSIANVPSNAQSSPNAPSNVPSTANMPSSAQSSSNVPSTSLSTGNGPFSIPSSSNVSTAPPSSAPSSSKTGNGPSSALASSNVPSTAPSIGNGPSSAPASSNAGNGRTSAPSSSNVPFTAPSSANVTSSAPSNANASSSTQSNANVSFSAPLNANVSSNAPSNANVSSSSPSPVPSKMPVDANVSFDAPSIAVSKGSIAPPTAPTTFDASNNTSINPSGPTTGAINSTSNKPAGQMNTRAPSINQSTIPSNGSAPNSTSLVPKNSNAEGYGCNKTIEGIPEKVIDDFIRSAEDAQTGVSLLEFATPVQIARTIRNANKTASSSNNPTPLYCRDIAAPAFFRKPPNDRERNPDGMVFILFPKRTEIIDIEETTHVVQVLYSDGTEEAAGVSVTTATSNVEGPFFGRIQEFAMVAVPDDDSSSDSDNDVDESLTEFSGVQSNVIGNQSSAIEGEGITPEATRPADTIAVSGNLIGFGGDDLTGDRSPQRWHQRNGSMVNTGIGKESTSTLSAPGVDNVSRGGPKGRYPPRGPLVNNGADNAKLYSRSGASTGAAMPNRQATELRRGSSPVRSATKIYA